MWSSSDSGQWRNASHFNKLSWSSKAQLGIFRHKQLHLVHETHVVRTENKPWSCLLSTDHLNLQKRERAETKSLVCNYRNSFSSITVAFCIENHCYMKTKTSTLLPLCLSVCLSSLSYYKQQRCRSPIRAPFHNYESQQGAFINVMLIFCIQLILLSPARSCSPIWKS